MLYKWFIKKSNTSVISSTEPFLTDIFSFGLLLSVGAA